MRYFCGAVRVVLSMSAAAPPPELSTRVVALVLSHSGAISKNAAVSTSTVCALANTTHIDPHAAALTNNRAKKSVCNDFAAASILINAHFCPPRVRMT